MVQRRQQPAYVFFAETCRGARQMTAAAGRRGASRGRRPISTKGELSSPSPHHARQSTYVSETCSSRYLPQRRHWRPPVYLRGISHRCHEESAEDKTERQRPTSTNEYPTITDRKVRWLSQNPMSTSLKRRAAAGAVRNQSDGRTTCPGCCWVSCALLWQGRQADVERFHLSPRTYRQACATLSARAPIPRWLAGSIVDQTPAFLDSSRLRPELSLIRLSCPSQPPTSRQVIDEMSNGDLV